MNCSECEGTYREKSGSLHFKDKYVGPLTVEHIKYYKCDQCGDRLFSVKAARRIESKASRVLDEILQSKPLRDFITAAKAAKVLGISRQALHKHRRIRRGFIFQTRFAGKTVYLEESVQRFMEAGDGRFPIGGH